MVGESGSGKSVTAYSVLGLLERAGRIDRGRILFDGRPCPPCADRELRAMRGRDVSIIFQNPRSALNPIRAVGRQLADILTATPPRPAPRPGTVPSRCWPRSRSRGPEER